MTSLEEKVKAFLKTDRQWPRDLRYQHARYQLKNAVSPEDKKFWKAVVGANAYVSLTTKEKSDVIRSKLEEGS